MTPLTQVLSESILGMETFRNSVKTFSRLELLFTLSLCMYHTRFTPKDLLEIVFFQTREATSEQFLRT